MGDYRSSDNLNEWKLRAEKELKGKPLESLNWKNEADIKLHPYYNQENSRGLFPVISAKRENGWDIFEPLNVLDAEKSNLKALAALNAGATGIIFKLNADFEMSDLPLLLKDIQLPYIQTGFIVPPSFYEEFCLTLAEYIRKKAWDPRNVNGYIQVNYSSFEGKELSKALVNSLAAVPAISAALIGFRLLVIDSAWFRELGLRDEQELGITLAWFKEWLDQLQDMGIPYTKVPKLWQVNLSAGGDYFLQVAKFRSVGYLLSLIASKYGTYSPIYTLGESARFLMSTPDRHSNLLRLSAGAMAAVQGNSNGLVLFPFTDSEKDSEEFKHRITRNIQLLLNHEAHIGDYSDPARGSYYIEELSFELAEKAWDYFLKIEDLGGFGSWIIKGHLESEIEESRASMFEEVAKRRRFVLGVNQFPGIWPEQTKTSKHFRLEQPLLDLVEFKRQKEQSLTRKIKSVSLVFGDPGMRSARATFTQNYLGCADIENSQLIYKQGDKLPEADIYVLCADDASYLDMAKSLAGNNGLFIIAGAPGELEAEYKQAGIHHFIHMKAPLVDTLKEIVEEIK